MRAMDRLACWRKAFESLIEGPTAGHVPGASVLWFWTTYGFHISDSLQGDPILARVLKQLLPSYEGAGLRLYRGEASDRHRARVYGMSWTPKLSVAQMFAHRRDPRGVVLQIDADPEAIFCGPTDHSRWLDEDEYLVDVTKIGEPMLVE